MANGRNGGAQLTWGNVILTLALGVTLFATLTGGFWIFFQAQFSSQREHVTTQIAFLKEELKLLEEATLRRDNKHDEAIIRLDAQLLARNQLFVQVKEFDAYLKLVDQTYARQQEINRQAIEAYQTVKAFDAWRLERDKRQDQTDKRMDAIERRVEGLENRRAKEP